MAVLRKRRHDTQAVLRGHREVVFIVDHIKSPVEKNLNAPNAIGRTPDRGCIGLICRQTDR